MNMGIRSMATAVLAALVVLVIVIISPTARADQSNIVNTQPAKLIDTQAIIASGIYTSRAFVALEHTNAQSVQVVGTGTSPNYKVEVLVTVDGENYVKPETGGDLGTFTDASHHVIAVSVPLSVGHKLRITELGGANTITITAWERSQ